VVIGKTRFFSLKKAKDSLNKNGYKKNIDPNALTLASHLLYCITTKDFSRAANAPKLTMDLRKLVGLLKEGH
jgi:hypothetical protein